MGPVGDTAHRRNDNDGFGIAHRLNNARRLIDLWNSPYRCATKFDYHHEAKGKTEIPSQTSEFPFSRQGIH